LREQNIAEFLVARSKFQPRDTLRFMIASERVNPGTFR
jgi:hypothetical protein